MRKITCIVLVMLMGIGTVLAEGGKNNGETGKGETSTGSEAQGQADQDRTGRGDGDGDDVCIFDLIEQGE
jgi:hypothetical protein